MTNKSHFSPLPLLASEGLTCDPTLGRALGMRARLVPPADNAVSPQVTQLEELLAVRHSVFVVGSAGAGKSQVLRSLHKTYQIMKRRPVWADLNPKAVTNDELFGIINPATRQWKDGKTRMPALGHTSRSPEPRGQAGVYIQE